jgi:Outer membrane cobalamin receptor protein
VSNVTLFDLPAGPVAMAFGFDKFDLYGEDNVDGLTEAGLSSGNPRLSTSGGYVSEDAYFEVQVPLVSDTFLAEELRVEFAARQSEFDSFEGDNVERVSLYWKPIEDLTIRGTDSTSYRAPTISNLFFGGGGGFPTYVDVCEQNYVAFTDAATQAALTAYCAAFAGLDTSTWSTFYNQILPLGCWYPRARSRSGNKYDLWFCLSPSIKFIEKINVAIAG